MAQTRQNIPCNDPPLGPFTPPKDPISGGLPSGGLAGQVLTKASDASGDVEWADGGGSGGTSTVAWKPTVAADGTITWTRTTSTTAPDPQNIKGPAGADGAQGPEGPQGPKGDEGFSPTITVAPITGGHRVTVTNETGSASFDVLDGQADSIEWVNIVNKPADLVEDQDYVHTDNNFTDADKTTLDNAASNDQLFVAEYNVTTAQEINEFINGTHDPCAPMVVKRGDDYYTVITAAKMADNRVIIRTFATLSGNFYIFTYDITEGTWANNNYGVQKILVSGTDIKTVNGESLLGSGDLTIGGASTWDEIQNKPTDLVQDTDYVHTDNNFTDADKDKLANLENYDDTALEARVTANETAIADRYTKSETDTLLDGYAEAVELAQAEYDALTDEAKLNGTVYFITDGQGGGGGGTNYSTTEEIVGTWIDGRPVYRKAVYGSTPALSPTGTIYAALASNVASSVDFFVNRGGSVQDGDGRSMPIGAQYHPANGDLQAIFEFRKSPQDDITLTLTTKTITFPASCKYNAWVEYVKK